MDNSESNVLDLPESITTLSNLRELIFDGRIAITNLPESIAKLSNLTGPRFDMDSKITKPAGVNRLNSPSLTRAKFEWEVK